jgi:hypothetical protein
LGPAGMVVPLARGCQLTSQALWVSEHFPTSFVLTGHFYWYYHPGRFILLQRPAV